MRTLGAGYGSILMRLGRTWLAGSSPPALLFDRQVRVLPGRETASHALDVRVPQEVQRHHGDCAAVAAAALGNDSSRLVLRQLVQALDESADRDVDRAGDLAVVGDLVGFESSQFPHTLFIGS